MKKLIAFALCAIVNGGAEEPQPAFADFVPLFIIDEPLYQTTRDDS